MSMHFAMGCALIRVFTFQKPVEIQRRNIAIIVVGLTSFITYHCVTDEFTLHIIVFLTLTFVVTGKTHSIIQKTIHDSKQRSKMSGLAYFGSGKLFACVDPPLLTFDSNCALRIWLVEYRCSPLLVC
jgi:dihydroceramidase